MATGQKFTNFGQAWVVDQLDPNFAIAGGSITYRGWWGDSGTTPAVTDTGVLTTPGESRVTITNGNITQQTTQSSGDTLRWVYTMTATSSHTVQETVILTGDNNTSAIIRIVHGPLSLESGDQVAYTVNLQFTDVSGS